MDNRTDTIPLFLSFCVEQYKAAHGLTGREAMERLLVCGAFDYLEDNYEVLHSQSPQWILEEIEDYVNKH